MLIQMFNMMSVREDSACCQKQPLLALEILSPLSARVGSACCYFFCTASELAWALRRGTGYRYFPAACQKVFVSSLGNSGVLQLMTKILPDYLVISVEAFVIF